MNTSNKLLSDIVTFRTYSKFLPHLFRREVFEETINRNMMMHLDRFPKLSKDIIKAYELVHDFKVMPSMRALQFSGEAIIKNSCRLFNCSFLAIDRVRAFGEIFFLSLSGVGCGYSVQRHHVDYLPKVGSPYEEGIFIIHDSIQGWAQALDLLMEAYFLNRIKPVFDFSHIRPKGARLITTGSVAPGPEPLKYMLAQVEKKLKECQGRKLKSIEVHDIVCMVSDCVLAGGIRRSALLSMFDRNDDDMLKAKTGEWWVNHPYRARANNSVVLPRGEVKKEEFMEIFNICKKSEAGEPGFVWTSNLEWGVNPCKPLKSLILTEKGYITYKQALLENELNVVTENGTFKASKPFLTGENKKVLKVLLSNGKSIYGTENHKHKLFSGVWEELGNLKVGDKLVYKNVSVATPEISDIDKYDKGLICGWVYADGWFSKRSDHAGHTVGMSFGVNEFDCVSLFENLLNIKVVPHEQKPDTCKYFSSHKIEHANILFKEGMGLDKAELTWLYGKDFSFKLGFIRSMFTADGSARRNDLVELYSIHKEALEVLCNILSEFGIFCTLTCHGKAKSYIAKDGKQRNNAATWKIAVPCGGYKKIGFLSAFKQTRLDLQEERELRSSNYVTIREITEDSVEDVYDITVDSLYHSYIDSGIITHNCCEVSMASKNFCNLTTINQTGIKDKQDLINRARWAALIGTLQATYTNFPYLRPDWKINSERDALLGVSFTGIADNNGDLPKEWLQEAAQAVKETNEKYAKKLGINVAARCTAVKPEGCRPYYELVTTDRGIFTLDEMFENHKVEEKWADYLGEEKVLNDNGESNKISKTFYNGKSKVYRITMSYGLTIDSTESHKWYVDGKIKRSKNSINGKKRRIEEFNQWVETKNIEKGDKIAIELGRYTNKNEYVFKKLDSMAVFMKGFVKVDHNIIKQPEKMNSDLAWLFGYLWGDGSMVLEKYRVKFIDQTDDTLNRVQQIIQEQFSIEGSLNKCKNKNAYTLEYSSKYLWLWLIKNDIFKYFNDSIDYIPKCVRCSSKESIIAFISGLIDSDGCTSVKERHKGKDKISVFSITNSQDIFSKHLQDVCFSVGICIGRSLNEKGKNFQKKKHIYLLNGAIRTTPEAWQLIKKYSLKVKRHESSDKFSGWVYDRPFNERYAAILGEVLSVECIGEMDTYDVEVEKSHWYYAGAVKSHNSVSCVLGSSSGIHARHSQYYLRRVRMDKADALSRYLSKVIPELCEPDLFSDTTTVVTIPQESPEGAIIRDNETAMTLFNRAMFYSENWIKEGHRTGDNMHNVSCTISVKDDEWDTLSEAMWKNREKYTGISVLPYNGGTYKQPPFESCDKETYDKYSALVKEIDLKEIRETNDSIDRMQSVACSNGACEVHRL